MRTESIEGAARAIGALLAAQVGDGSTLQAGIGEVPDATVAGVAGRRGLRVWTEVTNAPSVIAQQPGMTSVDTALQVDLFDQANASRIGARIHSGFGGQTHFTVGASHSRGGQAFMTLRSWHPRPTCRRSCRWSTSR